MVCSKIPYGVEQGIFLSRTRKLELPNRELSRPTGPTGVEFYLVFGVELWRGLRFTEFELVRSLPFARRWAFRWEAALKPRSAMQASKSSSRRPRMAALAAYRTDAVVSSCAMARDGA